MSPTATSLPPRAEPKPKPKKEGSVSEVQTADWPYRFEVLPVAELFVDMSYQRPLTSFVEKIAAKFDPALVGTLVVSERKKGEYAVVDGQTRSEAAKKVGVEKLPCLVYFGLSPAQEASLFARLQKERRGIASFHRFRASLVANEPEAVEINRIVEDCGYKVGLAGAGDKAISAVAGLEKVYRRDPALLERTLLILREAWSNRHTPSGEVLRGLAYFLHQNKSTDDEKLARRMSIVTPDEIKRRASALREGAGHGGGSDKYVAGAIEGIYKRGKDR